MQNEEFIAGYSDSLFWDKIKKQAASAGATLIYTAFIAYYTLNSDKVPAKIKTMLYGALGYFIIPMDVIPDITPAIGYADDLAVMMSVIRVLAFYITTPMQEKAKNRVKDLFGDGEAMEAVTKLNISIDHQPSVRI